MNETANAKGCLLGLACGDALGRPVEFNSAEEIESQHGEVTGMLGHGTHGQPPGTITDDTELALCIAESLVDRRGFDPADVADRFVGWLESGPFDIGLMTRDSLSRIRHGASWDDAGADVWESRPEGSNAGNGSVMRCAPHAIAFRHFDAELTQVSQLSSAITHADPRCRWGCVILNRTLAHLIRNERDPLGTALKNTYSAPDELRTALTQVQEVVTGDRDAAAFEAQLATSGYVVDSLQAGLYHGLTANSAETAIVQAVNSGGDTDTVGAIAGAVAGARFGSTNIPNRWTEEIEESGRLKRLARRLLTIRMQIPDKEYTTIDDGTLVFKQRTIEGPAYISDREFQEATIGHRPHPAPHRTIRTAYHKLTPATAAMLDWERRAYAVDSGRSSTSAGPQIDLDEEPGFSQPTLVPVPQYPFVDAFDELPDQDQQRIKRDGQAAADAFVRSYAAFAGIRHPITETETDTVGIERMDPIAGATRALVGTFGNVCEALLGHRETGGYDSPAEIEAAVDTSATEEIIADRPRAIHDVAEIFPQLASGTGAILDYLTQLRLPQQQTVTDASPEDQLRDLRERAHTMVGELHVISESLRRVAVRHPEIEHEQWYANTTPSGGGALTMVDVWLTTMSTNLEAVINPLIAACEDGYRPKELHVLDNPGVGDQFDTITSMMERVVLEYEGPDPELHVTELEQETDFEGIVEHFRRPIARINDEGGTVAVDVTPGRKFMSAMAFQAGIQFEADHVYYLYVSNNRFYGRLYPDVPRPVVDLVDFQEVFQ